jgi:hypothetical protein
MMCIIQMQCKRCYLIVQVVDADAVHKDRVVPPCFEYDCCVPVHSHSLVGPVVSNSESRLDVIHQSASEEAQRCKQPAICVHR